VGREKATGRGIIYTSGSVPEPGKQKTKVVATQKCVLTKSAGSQCRPRVAKSGKNSPIIWALGIRTAISGNLGLGGTWNLKALQRRTEEGSPKKTESLF